MQVDFCHADGSLYVPGSLGDMQRLIEFIYANAERITDITCSLDSHLPHQIFHPAWWADARATIPRPSPRSATTTSKQGPGGRW
ncbi:MAG: hypothetical protein M5U34_14605 [Chloroflexi bacterium]|nr:hypothetical protein [Chloroflexota bacterium]